ncbi:MAG: D-glycero-beta-D-manno-heptose 1,7-bisphosphate 7-phosphatase [Desulfobacterales bacterium]
MSPDGSKRIVFLDRDGVINRDSDLYVKSIVEMDFLPGSLEAIRRLTEAGRSVVVITNQSAVGRGWITEADLQEMHRYMRTSIEKKGGRLLDVFYCPHHPDDGCRCRKPKPGMIEAACRRYGVRPSSTAMVGDNVRDILCARNAGCGLAVLVRSGISDSEAEAARQGVRPDHTTDDLSDAVDWLLAHDIH